MNEIVDALLEEGTNLPQAQNSWNDTDWGDYVDYRDAPWSEWADWSDTFPSGPKN
mgnify:CR=1 FL=1